MRLAGLLLLHWGDRYRQMSLIGIALISLCGLLLSWAHLRQTEVVCRWRQLVFICVNFTLAYGHLALTAEVDNILKYPQRVYRLALHIQPLPVALEAGGYGMMLIFRQVVFTFCLSICL